MKLKHRALEAIGEQAVTALIESGEVFELREMNAYQCPCNSLGYCVNGDLMRLAGRDIGRFPRSGEVANALGFLAADEHSENLDVWSFLDRLQGLNDEGRLQRAEDVRAALLWEVPQEAITEEGDAP